MESSRRFPPPWTLIRENSERYIVQDANGVTVAWLFCRDGSSRYSFGAGLTISVPITCQPIAPTIDAAAAHQIRGRVHEASWGGVRTWSHVDGRERSFRRSKLSANAYARACFCALIPPKPRDMRFAACADAVRCLSIIAKNAVRPGVEHV